MWLAWFTWLAFFYEYVSCTYIYLFIFLFNFNYIYIYSHCIFLLLLFLLLSLLLLFYCYNNYFLFLFYLPIYLGKSDFEKKKVLVGKIDSQSSYWKMKRSQKIQSATLIHYWNCTLVVNANL